MWVPVHDISHSGLHPIFVLVTFSFLPTNVDRLSGEGIWECCIIEDCFYLQVLMNNILGRERMLVDSFYFVFGGFI